MKKIILAAAVAMVAGTPIAFAATSGNTNTAEPGSRTCTYQGEKFDLCHQDTHKNGGAQSKAGGFRK
jgi:Ni/Co efflux regulator RcnB